MRIKTKMLKLLTCIVVKFWRKKNGFFKDQLAQNYSTGFYCGHLFLKECSAVWPKLALNSPASLL